MCDFETTVYEGQTCTEVWAAACVELYTEDVKIFHSINEQFEYFKSLKSNLVCYYHNLKFDGAFWLSFLLADMGFKQATYGEISNNTLRFVKDSDMSNNSIAYSISDMGQWYRITIKTGGYYIELRDSLKLLPFSVKYIGESFGTQHKKLDMEYKGFRYPGCEITEEEQLYIRNDVLVVKEALEIMFNDGHNKLTIGSCCLAEYKKSLPDGDYRAYFPNVYEIVLPEEYKTATAGDWLRRAYRGGWCYLVKGKEGKIFHNGITADVNSLYPSMMSSESGNKFPVGKPTFWRGNFIPEEAKQSTKYYFIRIRTRFYLRKGRLPFVQIKGNLLYKGTEMLETSDIYNRADGKHYPYYTDSDGNIHPALVELTLTMTDFELLKQHYQLVDFEIIDGCYFNAAIGIFDEYIEKYKQIKLTSKGAKKQEAKLFLNNLYGKMASSPDSCFKYAFVKEDKSIGFYQVIARDKKPGYIPVGAAITSYARNFTIRAAQKNFYGADSPGFIYADTDSIHVDLPAEQIKGITVHPKNFCCWKLESSWDEAFFTRQKTYIEHIVEEDLEPIEKPYYSVKCAGMPQQCKALFLKSLEAPTDEEELKEFKLQLGGEYSEEEIDFISLHRTLEDFTLGLTVPGKLLPKRIPGGVLLTETTYKMR